MEALRYQIKYTHDDVVVGALPGQVVAIWTDTPTKSSVLALERELVVMSKHCQPTYLGLTVSDIRLPDSQTRQAFIHLAQTCNQRTSAIAMVVQGSGFAASAVRATITGFGMAAGRLSFPFKVFADLSSATEWMCRYGNPRYFPQVLTEAVVALGQSQTPAKRLVALSS